MLRKKSSGSAKSSTLQQALAANGGGAIDRRAFLARSGLLTGGVALASALPIGTVKKADAAEVGPLSAGATRVKSVCTHCSVGCTVIAEVKNGVWVGQEPGWDSPFNMGSHCAKGASVREHAHNERRLKYPLKLEGGQWKRVKWEQAHQRDRRQDARDPQKVGSRIRSTGWVRPSSITSKPISSASSMRSGVPTIATIKRASATPPRSRASRIRGATAR